MGKTMSDAASHTAGPSLAFNRGLGNKLPYHRGMAGLGCRDTSQVYGTAYATAK